MNDQQLIDALRTIGTRPATPDAAFVEQVWNRIGGIAARRRPTFRYDLLLVPALLLIAALALAIAVGSNLLRDAPLSVDASSSPVAPGDSSAARSSGTLNRIDVSTGRPRRIVFSYVAPVGLSVTPAETPDDVGLAVFTSTPSDTIFEDAPEPGAYGISVADVTGAEEHGSLNTNPPFGAMAADFMVGLDTSSGFVVENLQSSSLGGLPAWSGRVSVEGAGWPHIDITTPRGLEGSAFFSNANITYVADLDDDVVVLVQVWADTPETLARWLPRAMVFVDSIRFEIEQ